MSKKIKQLQMDALGKQFDGVRDLVVLTVTGVDSITDNKMRLALRKKGIRLQMVKNSLTRRVFADLGMNVAKGWEGPTTLAWGGSSVAELSKEISPLLKKYEKNFKVKGAVADGQEITFDLALKMPTRAEALGRVISLALSPARRLASQILGPASQVAGQIKSLKDRKEPEAATGRRGRPCPAAETRPSVSLSVREPPCPARTARTGSSRGEDTAITLAAAPLQAANCPHPVTRERNPNHVR